MVEDKTSLSVSDEYADAVRRANIDLKLGIRAITEKVLDGSNKLISHLVREYLKSERDKDKTARMSGRTSLSVGEEYADAIRRANVDLKLGIRTITEKVLNGSDKPVSHLMRKYLKEERQKG